MKRILMIKTTLFALTLATLSTAQSAHAVDEDLPSSVLQQQAYERGFEAGKHQCAQHSGNPRSAPKTVLEVQFACERDNTTEGVRGNVVRTTLYSDGTSVRATVAQSVPLRGRNGYGILYQNCQDKAAEMNARANR